MTRAGISILLLLILSVTNVCSAQGDGRLPDQAHAAFKRYCFECHGQNGSDEGGMNYVTDLAQLVTKGKVVPKNGAKSRILIRMESKDDPMPPTDKTGADRPSAETVALIRQWIETGARPQEIVANKVEPARPFISNSAVMASIFAHLDRLDPEDRPFKRYFTLNHLHNQSPTAVSSSRLRLMRAAVAKALNSLSWSSELVIPQPIDADQTILMFDIRDVDWDANEKLSRPDLWTQVVAKYPYAMTFESYPDERKSRDMSKQVYAWTKEEIPWVRADWFVASALRPPLYHTLLFDKVFPELAQRTPVQVKQVDGSLEMEAPMTAGDLEKWLRVDVTENIRRNKAVRAGFSKSGVSAQPRIIERHTALYGAYWKSYDFKIGNTTMNPQSFPLGPPGVNQDKKLQRHEFKHDGGEIVFHLPNGLQGYLLVDDKDRRINVGPSDVVEDNAKTLGNSLIVTGVSCVACHKQGMKREFGTDQVRFGIEGLSSVARDKVRKLYLDPAEMNRYVDKDEARFLRAVEECYGHILRTGPDDKRETSALDEPVGPVTKNFLSEEIGINDLAAELGIEKPENLIVAIKNNPDLQRVGGLIAVANGGKLKREILEQGSGQTLYQQAARILKMGTPHSVVP